MSNENNAPLENQKNNSTTVLFIILAIILIFSCCCCLLLLLVGWYAGDYVVDWFRMFINIWG